MLGQVGLLVLVVLVCVLVEEGRMVVGGGGEGQTASSPFNSTLSAG